MFTLTLLALAVSTVLIFTTVALLRRLNETEAELERTQQRMARLDELIDGLAAQEEETTRERLDSAQLVAVSLDFDTDDVFDEAAFLEDQQAAAYSDEDEDEFAAPRMGATREASADDIPRMTLRPRLDTPVVTPRNTLPPGYQDSILEVGSIQVRSEALQED